jgi:hypothetical protein
VDGDRWVSHVSEADNDSDVILRSMTRLGSISARRSGHRGDHPFGSLRLARLTASLLASVLVTLVPFAYFSPPDQTWIAGLYDDADYDDAVVAVTGVTRARKSADAPDGFPAIDGTIISPARLLSARVALVRSTRPDAPSRISPVDRAPPHR